jgi:hypothetical protein
MTELDLSALEKALSSKSRQPRQSLSSSTPKSKHELFDEAKKLACELHEVYHKKLGTRYQGDSYYVAYWDSSLRRNNDPVGDITNVPIQVFKNLVNNGIRWLKDYHNMLNILVTQFPELALEANLEGKSGSELINYIYFKRIGELERIIRSRILSPEGDILVKCDVWFENSVPQFHVSVSGWLHQSRGVSISGIEQRPQHPEDMAKLLYFLGHFNEVADQINKQIDKITIVRR